jgi:hypothetical protein
MGIHGPCLFDNGYILPDAPWKSHGTFVRIDGGLYVDKLDWAVPLGQVDQVNKSTSGKSVHAFFARHFQMPEDYHW